MRKIFLALTLVLFLNSSSWAAYSVNRDKIHALEVLINIAKTYENITINKKGGPSVQSDDYDLDGRNSAVFANNGARLTIKGSSSKITTTDANHSHGVYVDNSADKNTKINLSETTININSDYSAGIMAANGGTISADKIKITTSGDYSPAIYIGQNKGNVFISGGTFTTKSAYSPIILISSDSEISISNATLTASHASSDLIVAKNSSNSTLDISGVTFSGVISADEDSTLEINLKNKSTFTGEIKTSGDVSINLGAGTTWKLTGNSYVKALTNKGKIISNDFSIFVDGSETSEDIVNHDAPSISTDSLDLGYVGVEYSDSLSVSGVDEVKWSISSGTLPDGLELDEDTGIIAGTPTTVKNYSFTVKASNDYGVSTKALSINIKNTPTAPSITTTALSVGTVDKSYSFTMKASGTTPITWSADNVPEGMDFTSKGVLSGTVSTVGTYTITFKASNVLETVSKDLDLVISQGKPKIITTSLVSGDTDSEYSSEIEFSMADSASVKGLPAGITSTDLQDGVITLSGTPEEYGTFTVKVTAKNDTGTVSKNLSLIIYSKPVITTTSTDVTVNSNFSLTLKATGTSPITWASSGDIPSGVSLSSSGVLKGKVTENKTFKVIAKNSVKSSDIDFVIRTKNAKPTLTGNVKQGTVDVNYAATFKAKGSGDITITTDSEFPDGLEFEYDSEEKTATLSGTPTETFSKKISVSASNDGGTVTKTFNLVIKAVKPTITTTALANGEMNKEYEAEISVTGTKTITVSVTGLPKGLSYNDGKISGTPTAFGKFTAKITAKNSVGTATKSLKLNISAAPTINSITLSAATIGKSYSKKFTAKGTTPLKWKISDGALPSGMKLNASNGTLSGTPKEFGYFNFTVFVSNDCGSDTFEVSDLKVNSVAPKITTSSLKSGTEGKSYTVTLKASGTAPITWEASNLPEGLSIDGNTGIISGTPSESGKFRVTVSAANKNADNNDVSVSKTLTMSIAKSKISNSNSTAKSTPIELKIQSESEPEINEFEPEYYGTTYNEKSKTEQPKAENKSRKATKNEIPEGYIQVADLGTVSADQDGLYDFEIELDEDAETGAELLWLAFPKDVEASEDDEICEFYDSEGQEIDSVPEDKIINISVWLEEGIIYEPVIAAKEN